MMDRHGNFTHDPVTPVTPNPAALLAEIEQLKIDIVLLRLERDTALAGKEFYMELFRGTRDREKL